MRRVVQGGVLSSDVAEKGDVRTQGCWQEVGRKCDQEMPSQVEREQFMAWEQFMALKCSVCSKNGGGGKRLGSGKWPSGFPYFLQFKSEFCNKEFMI